MLLAQQNTRTCVGRQWLMSVVSLYDAWHLKLTVDPCVGSTLSVTVCLTPESRCMKPDKCLGRPGGHCGEPAPDPIPNSAVKTPSAYDTTSQDVGKSVAARSSKALQLGCYTMDPVAVGQPSNSSTIQQPTHAGWSSPVARQAHNLKVVGSNPTPATTLIC